MFKQVSKLFDLCCIKILQHFCGLAVQESTYSNKLNVYNCNMHYIVTFYFGVYCDLLVVMTIVHLTIYILQFTHNLMA